MNSACGKRENKNPDINSNLKAVLVGILHSSSSADMPLSIQQIALELDRLTAVKNNTSCVTIRKHMDELWSFSNDPVFSSFFNKIYGGRIIKYYLSPSSTRSKRIYIEASEYEYTYVNDETSRNAKAFYAYEPTLSAQDLFMLLSSVQTNPYFSAYDISALQRKMKGITTSNLFRQACSSKSISSGLLMDEHSTKLLGNIASLLNYMNEEIQLEINYGKYTISSRPLSNEKFMLTPTRTTQNGMPKWQRIDPVATFEANGFYYLAAHTDKSVSPDDIISYRIDRIIEMRPFLDTLSRKPVPVDNDVLEFRRKFSALEYTKSHPVMYSGEKSDITMLVLENRNLNPVNTLLDTFGRDITIRPATDADVIPHLGHTVNELRDMGEIWYSVHLHHSIPGTIQWAKQNIENVLITYPQEAIDIIKEDTSRGLSRYK